MPKRTLPANDELFRILDLTPKKGDRKKLEIIQAAVECLGTHAQITVEAVAKHLGISTSHVVYHFGTKDELLLQMVRYVVFVVQSMTVARLKKSVGWRSQIKLFLESTLDWAYQYPTHLTVHSLLYLKAQDSAPFRQLHSEIREKGRERIVAILKGAVAEKILTAKEIPQIACIIQELLTGVLVEIATTTQWKDRKKSYKHIIASTEHVLGVSV